MSRKTQNTHADRFLAEAGRALHAGEFGRARALIANAIKATPHRLDLHVARGHVELGCGDPARAAETCRAVIARDPHDIAAWNLLGRALASADGAGAERAWRQALQLQPANMEALFN